MRVSDKEKKILYCAKNVVQVQGQNMTAAHILALVSNVKGSGLKEIYHNCGIPGHWNPNCPLLQKEKNSQMNSNNDKSDPKRSSPGDEPHLYREG